MSNYDPTDILDEEQPAGGGNTTVEQELRWEIADLVWLMGNKRGRRVVWRLLNHAGVYRLSYQPGDALQTAFNEGQRNSGLRLIALLTEHCSEAYATMIEERTNVRR